MSTSEKWVVVYQPYTGDVEYVYGIFSSKEAAEEWAREEYGYYSLGESAFAFRIRKAGEWA